MKSSDVRRWFAGYLDAFGACGRGEAETESLLAYYGVPLVVTTDQGSFVLTSHDQVVAAVRPQIDGMRAAAYARSETVRDEVVVLNSTSALYRGTFSRRRADGGEIGRLAATYLVTDGAVGRRISVLAVQTVGSTRLDHVACPCFELEATHRFWTEVMGAPLAHAQSGSSWLLVAYEFAGVMLDYFVVRGEPRPPSRGRDEIRHVGIAVGSPAELAAWKAKVEASGTEMWTEDHGQDEHVYFYDPSGNLFELTADEWTVRGKGTDPAAALRVLDAWRAQ